MEDIWRCSSGLAQMAVQDDGSGRSFPLKVLARRMYFPATVDQKNGCSATHKNAHGVSISDWPRCRPALRKVLLCFFACTCDYAVATFRPTNMLATLERFARCVASVALATKSSPLSRYGIAGASQQMLSLLGGRDVVYVDFPAIHSGYEHGCRDSSGRQPTLAAHMHTAAEFMFMRSCDGMLTHRSSFGHSAQLLGGMSKVAELGKKQETEGCPTWDLSARTQA